MWPTFRTENPVHMHLVTENDLTVTSIAFGFTMGFGCFVVYHAVQRTRRAPRWSTFIVMCWLEIIVSVVFAGICMLHMRGVIPYSFWVYFSIVTCWALQVQFLLQIIANRVCVLLHSPESRMRLKLAVAIWITLINITVYCIWIPAKLQISHRFHVVNLWWDRTEKCLYLITDGVLNGVFITIVRKRLVNMGLKKYDRLVKFNQYIIFVSLAMDVLIIGMMSYRNDFAYLQFHPLAYLVKLEIEMTMSKLIIEIAQTNDVQLYDGHDVSTPADSDLSIVSRRKVNMPVEVNIDMQVVTKHDVESGIEQHEMKDVHTTIWQSSQGIQDSHSHSRTSGGPLGDVIIFPRPPQSLPLRHKLVMAA